MKKIIIAMAAIAAAFTTTSCNKEPLVEQEENTALGNCIITASTESNLTKTSLYGNDTDGYEVVWSEGDTFNLAGNTFTLIEGAGTTSGTFQGNLPDYNGWFTAYYPSSYDGSNWPTEQTYTEGNGITGSPMEAGFSCNKGNIVGGKAEFKNVGGILRLTLKGTATIKYIKVSADGLDEITLNCGSGVSLDADGTAFHIAMREGEYSGVSISIWTIGFDNCTKTLKEGRNLVINKSEITPASFTADFPAPTSTIPLPGAFSIAEGKQVCFSRGNLRYTIGYDSGEWSFYDKQYKCGPLHAVDNKEISLFTWGYNATQSINPIGSTSNNVSVTSGDLSATQDWGCTINDGNAWRTLTSAEWTYLFVGRTDAADKYGYATVGGQKGLIILPDEFTDPMKNGGSGAFKPQSSTASSWTDNYYTLAGNWEAMEAAGAVFLPAAGRRGGDSIATGSNEQGHYWSSSAADSDKAYFVYFNYNSFDPAYSWSCGAGCSVRLVTDLYTVTFDMNGKTSTAPESIRGILRGSKITKPSVSAINDYRVSGWYKDPACTQVWNFDSDVVTSNITLYADWTRFGAGYGEVKAEAGIPGNKVKWIQLWDGGPKFAEFNVGAKSVTECGGHYQWGGSVDNGSNDYCADYRYLEGDSDTAYKLWGGNWRMPSLSEFKALLWTYCDIVGTDNYNDSGIKGLIFTGRGDYSFFSIFLPAGFHANLDYGYYWTNTPASDDYSYFLSFFLNRWGISNFWRSYNYYVRAVYVGNN